LPIIYPVLKLGLPDKMNILRVLYCTGRNEWPCAMNRTDGNSLGSDKLAHKIHPPYRNKLIFHSSHKHDLHY